MQRIQSHHRRVVLVGGDAYYVLVFVKIAPRQICIARITLAPEGKWMKQMARNLTMAGKGFLNGCRSLLHDRKRRAAKTARFKYEGLNAG